MFVWVAVISFRFMTTRTFLELVSVMTSVASFERRCRFVVAGGRRQRMRHMAADALRDFSFDAGVMRRVDMRIHRTALRLHLNILFDKRLVGTVALETVVLQHGTGLNGHGKDGRNRKACKSQVHELLHKWADGPPKANRRP